MGNNSDKDRTGCAIWVGVYTIPALIVLIFSNSIEDHPFLFIFSIIGVLYILYAFIKGKTESSSTSSYQVPSVSQTPVSPSIPSNYNESENQLNKLLPMYRLADITSGIAVKDSLYEDLKPYRSFTVMTNVKKVYALRKGYLDKLASLKTESDKILECPGCHSANIKISYIKNNEFKLKENKATYQNLQSKLQHTQVLLTSNWNTAFVKFSAAISGLYSSKKSYSQSNVPLHSFIKLSSTIPGDLFSSKVSPIEFNFGAYKFYALPDVVLAFDKDNCFVVALEPSVLNIAFGEKRKSVVMTKQQWKDEWTTDDVVIDVDSTLITEGPVRTSWLYEKKAGGPDLRYSYNPKYERRTDTYSYTEFSLRIGKYKAVYALSKGGLTKELQEKVYDYCISVRGGNTIASLLRLFEGTVIKNEEAKLLSERYESIDNDEISRINQEKC